MSNHVLVLDSDKKPLTPCRPITARKLLKVNKAAVYRSYPFTIILKKRIHAVPASITLKLDPGSKVTGVALVHNNQLIWGAELHHRGQAIKQSIVSRQARRRGRRYRHTRYRPARYLNRKLPKGWLAPSLKHRVDTTMTWVNRLIKLTPVLHISQELVRFDLQQLENPEVSGMEYQQGELQGYEVREYLLNKWGRECAYCSTKDVALQIEHIQPRSKGGSNRISNLCLACEKCNLKKGNQDIKQFLAKKPDLLKQILAHTKRSLKDSAAVNSTRWALYNRLKETGLPVSTGSGGLTKYNRIRLGFPKSHWLDAACVGQVDQLEIRTLHPLIIRATGHGTRQMCRTDKFGFPSRHVPRLKYVKGFQTGDIVKATVTKGKKTGTYAGRIAVRSTGSFNISDKSGVVNSISFKYCALIHRKDGYRYGF